jgi:hypothetical protein
MPAVLRFEKVQAFISVRYHGQTEDFEWKAQSIPLELFESRVADVFIWGKQVPNQDANHHNRFFTWSGSVSQRQRLSHDPGGPSSCFPGCEK